jgi:RNA polymerase sigma-70 factor (ECF subfamily)
MVTSNTQSGFASPVVRPGTAHSLRSANSKIEAVYDSELVRRFNFGDENAFDEIVRRYRSKISSIALSHLRNHADAEEIAQDTFIRAHRGLARFRGDSSLATWLHRIAFNLSRNRCKYYDCRRRSAMLSLDCAFSSENDTTIGDLIACGAPSPARAATSGEFSELVNRCMGKLGVRQQEILRLRNVLDQSYGEIAKALGISIGTVKSRIGRAREKLRGFIAEAYPELPSNASPFDWFDTLRSSGRVSLACA